MDAFGVQFDPVAKKVLFNPSTQKAMMARILHIYSGSLGGVKKDLYKGLSNPLWSYLTITHANKISLDTEENVYCVGEQIDSKNIWKFDRHGNLIWDALYGGGAGELKTCGIGPDDCLVVAGVRDNGKHIWKIDQNQDLVWDYDCGAGVQVVNDLILDPNNVVYAAGGGSVWHDYCYWRLASDGGLVWRVPWADCKWGTGRSIDTISGEAYLYAKGEGGFVRIRKSDGDISLDQIFSGGTYYDEIALSGYYIYLATEGSISKWAKGSFVFNKFVYSPLSCRDIVMDKFGNCVVGSSTGIKVISDAGVILWEHAVPSYGVAIRPLYNQPF